MKVSFALMRVSLVTRPCTRPDVGLWFHYTVYINIFPGKTIAVAYPSITIDENKPSPVLHIKHTLNWFYTTVVSLYLRDGFAVSLPDDDTSILTCTNKRLFILQYFLTYESARGESSFSRILADNSWAS